MDLAAGTKIIHGINGLVGVATGVSEFRGRVVQADGTVTNPGRQWHKIKFDEDTFDRINGKKIGVNKDVERWVAEDHFSDPTLWPKDAPKSEVPAPKK